MKHIVFLVFILLIGCSINLFEHDPVPIIIKIVDEKNNPISDAIVSINAANPRNEKGELITFRDAPTTANKNGIYERTMPIGSFRISVRSKSKGYIINRIIKINENSKYFTLKRNIFGKNSFPIKP
ncbi:hypothetical protein SAMN05444392_111101 [Seinonella peptonophila]|uniref:Carboxypeptidase regulatory-like domain-containing protein n=1 Tax=Seinonella peptonophila TaxID=112248 RepID=A0A1M5A1I2_9BACL|nr:hypothetical protein [Seinonella peptonophila]SHF24200.1 hypothetical protein SAMN05444392_111101 [Seinonella peptonophila]